VKSEIGIVILVLCILACIIYVYYIEISNLSEEDLERIKKEGEIGITQTVAIFVAIAIVIVMIIYRLKNLDVR